MAQVSLEDVSKTYAPSITAVRDLTLRVGDGELMVLLGPSGCGKTTTLRLIAGLEQPDAGTIRIDGRVVNDVRPKDRDVALVFQDYALYPHLSVRRNLAFALRFRRVRADEIDRRVREAARLLDLTDVLERKPPALSGGQRQRVAVGRAIVRDPKCCLFDEPLSNLDARLRTRLRAELKTLHERLKTTTLYVTHDQEEAMTLGERIAVMWAGEIQQVGPPLEVYRRPSNRFVAGFVGSPPMNFIDGRLEPEGRRLVFCDGEGLRLPLTDSAAGPLASHAGRAVVLGVRPPDLHPRPDGIRRALRLEAQVTLTEPLGDRLNVSARLGGGVTLVARVDPAREYTPGRPTSFHVDPAAIHLFEPGERGGRIADEGTKGRGGGTQ